MEKKTLVIVGNGSLASRCAKLFFDHSSQFELKHIAVDMGPQKYASGLEVMAKKLAIPHSLETSLSKGNFLKILQDIKPDYIFSLFNSQILTEEMFSQGSLAVNFHNSLLPRYAGSNAPSWALVNGEKESGVTFHRMEKTIDAGDVILQRKFSISDQATALEITSQCMTEGYELLAEHLELFATGSIPFQPQNMLMRTYHSAKAIPLEGWINCNWDLKQFLNFIRAFDYSPLRSPIGSPKLRLAQEFIYVEQANPLEISRELSPGSLELKDQKILLHLRDGMAELTRVLDKDLQILDAHGIKSKYLSPPHTMMKL